MLDVTTCRAGRKAARAVDPGLWPLDPRVIFLNHGSFGSCLKAVLRFQRRLRERLERRPVQFYVRELESLLDEARSALGSFVGAESDDLVFVPNATSGVNTVLRSLQFRRGDELVVTDHEYNACRNALDFVAARGKARVVVAVVPFPIRDEQQVLEAILGAVTRRTRLVLLDHVTSQTGLVLPAARLVAELEQRNVETLVDGAHGPGMLPLNLEQLGATYYTGNCHKWIGAPKGAAFLHVRRDRQKLIRPLTISHGANSPRTDRSRFQIEFGWTGTMDPTAWLSVPEAIRLMGGLLPGGWSAVMRRNRALALEARKILCRGLEVEAPSPAAMIGSLVSIPLPDSSQREVSRSPLYQDPLQDELLERHRIEVPVIPWPESPRRLLRVSAQLYNSPSQYRILAESLRECLGRRDSRVRRGTSVLRQD
jgi:isopenicillin-N epimerase